MCGCLVSIQLPYLLLSHGKSNQADALNCLPPQEPVFLPRHIGHNVLEAGHEAVVVGHKMFLNGVSYCGRCRHNLFQNQLLAFLKKLQWERSKVSLIYMYMYPLSSYTQNYVQQYSKKCTVPKLGHCSKRGIPSPLGKSPHHLGNPITSCNLTCNTFSNFGTIDSRYLVRIDLGHCSQKFTRAAPA